MWSLGNTTFLESCSLRRELRQLMFAGCSLISCQISKKRPTTPTTPTLESIFQESNFCQPELLAFGVAKSFCAHQFVLSVCGSLGMASHAQHRVVRELFTAICRICKKCGSQQHPLFYIYVLAVVSFTVAEYAAAKKSRLDDATRSRASKVKQERKEGAHMPWWPGALAYPSYFLATCIHLGPQTKLGRAGIFSAIPLTVRHDLSSFLGFADR